jgi:hypothetical protein
MWESAPSVRSAEKRTWPTSRQNGKEPLPNIAAIQDLDLSSHAFNGIEYQHPLGEHSIGNAGVFRSVSFDEGRRPGIASLVRHSSTLWLLVAYSSPNGVQCPISECGESAFQPNSFEPQIPLGVAVSIFTFLDWREARLNP